MSRVSESVSNREVFRVSDMPHFAPYLQFLTNILQIHFEYVRQGEDDYNITEAFVREDFNSLCDYISKLETGAKVAIGENDARVLYAMLVVVSRLLLCDYGEQICQRLTRNLPAQHRWHSFEHFRNDLLRHNTQMLIDMDQNMDISGLDLLRPKLDAVCL